MRYKIEYLNQFSEGVAEEYFLYVEIEDAEDQKKLIHILTEGKVSHSVFKTHITLDPKKDYSSCGVNHRVDVDVELLIITFSSDQWCNNFYDFILDSTCKGVYKHPTFPFVVIDKKQLKGKRVPSPKLLQKINDFYKNSTLIILALKSSSQSSSSLLIDDIIKKIMIFSYYFFIQNNRWGKETIAYMKSIKEANEPFVAYHPALSTINEAKNDYDLVNSDHVSFLVKIPRDTSDKSKGEICIVSWNVLEADLYNGFAPTGTYGESDHQRNKRYERIANSLALIVDRHQPPFIALQEIMADYKDDTYLCSHITRKLKGYQCVEFNGERSDGGRCIIFYHTEMAAPIFGDAIKSIDNLEHVILNGSLCEFVMTDTAQKIKLLSAHPSFSLIPAEREKEIADFLTEQGNDILSIVIGVFNCNVVPVHDLRPRNITTCVLSPMFRQGKRQGAVAIDGCFYSYGDRLCWQAESQHLDPLTGNIFTEAQLASLPLKTLNESQREEVTQLRMVMCLDHSYQQKKMIDGQYTIFEYEEFLKRELENNHIVVRAARTVNNEPGISIAVSPSVFQLLGLNEKDERIQVNCINNTSEGHFYIFSVRNEHIHFLIQAFDETIKKSQVPVKSKPQDNGWLLLGLFQTEKTISDAKERKLLYTYTEKQQAVPLVINLNYHYEAADIKAILGKRLRLLSGWMKEQGRIDFSTQLWSKRLIVEGDLSHTLELKLSTKLESNAMIFGRTDERRWVTLLFLFDEEKPLQVYYIDPLGGHLPDSLAQSIKKFRETYYPQCKYEIHSEVHYIQSRPEASAVLAIENGIQALKHFYLKDKAPFKPIWCDDTTVTILRGEQLRLIGGPEAELYKTQKASADTGVQNSFVF